MQIHIPVSIIDWLHPSGLESYFPPWRCRMFMLAGCLLPVCCWFFVSQLHRILEYNTQVRLLVVCENVLWVKVTALHFENEFGVMWLVSMSSTFMSVIIPQHSWKNTKWQSPYIQTNNKLIRLHRFCCLSIPLITSYKHTKLASLMLRVLNN